MKKWLGLLFSLIILVSFSSCSAGKEAAVRTEQNQTGVNAVLEERMAEEEKGKNEEAGNESPEGEAKPAEEEKQNVTESVLQEEESAPTPTPESSPKAVSQSKGDNGIDIDLTALSGTMVYSEVYRMIVIPEEYLGKTIKMKGNFAIYQNETTGEMFYACLIQDATACCAQGIEFVLKGEHSYPDDYPARGSEITVEGVFDTYMDGEFRYCTLRDATLL